METEPLQVGREEQAILLDISRRSGKPVDTLLAESVALLRRQYFLNQLNAGYAAIKEDPAAYATLQDELQAWDATIGDGLLPSVGRSSR